MRTVDKYIETLTTDVVTAGDLVYALNHGEGMTGTIAELYDVQTGHRNVTKWDASRNARAGKDRFMPLGRFNIITYDMGSEETTYFTAKTFEYACSKPLLWRFDMFKSICISANYVVEEDDCEAADDSNATDGHVTEQHIEFNTGTALFFWEGYWCFSLRERYNETSTDEHIHCTRPAANFFQKQRWIRHWRWR